MTAALITGTHYVLWLYAGIIFIFDSIKCVLQYVLFGKGPSTHDRNFVLPTLPPVFKPSLAVLDFSPQFALEVPGLSKGP